jgi:hypothetical protein
MSGSAGDSLPALEDMLKHLQRQSEDNVAMQMQISELIHAVSSTTSANEELHLKVQRLKQIAECLLHPSVGLSKQQSLSLEAARSDAGMALQLSSTALDVASGLASRVRCSAAYRNNSQKEEALERQKREMELRVSIIRSSYSKREDPCAMLWHTLIRSCGMEATFVAALMEDVVSCRVTQLRRNSSSGCTIWVTFRNSSAKQACWKARHDANQYSRIYGQHEVQFTQSLTQQQRDDVECFKAVVTLATQLGRRVELIHFPVVMLRA